MRKFGVSAALALLPALCLAAGCARKPALRPLVIFNASQLTALLEELRPAVRERLGRELALEPTGSQIACRKVVELGRECDLLVLADEKLVGEMLAGTASWRLDFASDEIVLAVGARAPAPDEAERDWPAVLLRPDARLARVDENLGSIGYRTLLAWKLQEQFLGPPGLYDNLLARTEKVVEHVTQLAPLLRKGEVDYGFVYRSLCHAWDLRYIRLDPRVNLGDPAQHYERTSITIKSDGRDSRALTIMGGPILNTLTIPDRHPDPAAARAFIRYLLGPEGRATLTRARFILLPRARFYGPLQLYAPFQDIADYAGEAP